MSDYKSGLPIRSEADGTDERVHSKLVDYTTPSQGMTVDTDGNAHIEVHGNRVDDSADIALELTEEGKAILRGDYEADDNSEPSSVGLIAGSRSASPGYTTSTLRVSAIAGESDSICLDVALHDEAGNFYNEDNPMPVEIVEGSGVEIHDYNTASAVVSDATDNHDYSVATGVVFLLKEVLASASGKMKVELQIGDGEVEEAFVSTAVNFNSTAHPDANIPLKVPIKVTGSANTTTIRVIRTNLDNQSQDLYSTLVAEER